MFFNEYPYTDFHELNLDMILKMIHKMYHDINEFEALNTITNAGAWDITKQYQAWTIVSDNNAGYISLKPVPAGIAISNTDYWGLIADYDILITDLSNRITALENGLSSLSNTVNNTVLPAITNINTEIAAIKNKRFIFVCDSYGQTTADSGTAYPYQIAANLNKTLDVDFYVTAYGGASWKGLNGRPSFKEVLQLIENNVTDKDTIDYIFVCGGVNDAAGTMSDIYSGASDFMTYARATYPNATVITGMIGWNTDPGTMLNIKNISYPAYNNLGAYGIGVINNAENPMHDYRYFQIDGTHPNASGNAALAYALTSFIISGNIASNGRGSVNTTVTLNSAKFQSGTLKFTEYKTNNGVFVKWDNADLQLASGQTIDFEELVTIGTKDSIYWKSGGDPFAASIKAFARLAWSDGDGYHSEPCQIIMYNDNGVIKFQIIASKQFDDIPGLIYLSLTGGCQYFPTIEC